MNIPFLPRRKPDLGLVEIDSWRHIPAAAKPWPQWKGVLALCVLAFLIGYILTGLYGLIFAIRHGYEYPVPGFQVFNWWWSWAFSK